MTLQQQHHSPAHATGIAPHDDYTSTRTRTFNTDRKRRSDCTTTHAYSTTENAVNSSIIARRDRKRHPGWLDVSKAVVHLARYQHMRTKKLSVISTDVSHGPVRATIQGQAKRSPMVVRVRDTTSTVCTTPATNAIPNIEAERMSSVVPSL